jgi:esterase
MKLNYKVTGEGRPLIIAHGLFGSLDNWLTLARRFGESHKTYIVDMRNHGKSPRADSHSYQDMAHDLLAFMDDHALHDAVLLGHSMGGKAVMEAAMLSPERMAGVVIADMAPVAYTPHHNEIFDALLGLNLQTLNNRAEAEAALAPKIPEAAVRQFLLKNIDRTPEGKYEWKMNLPVLYKEYNNILNEISHGIYTGPTLALRGERSQYIRDIYLPAFEHRFTDFDVMTIPGAGHWIHAEKPEDFYEKVRNFLQKNDL